MSERIAITGMGIISSIGIGTENFLKSLKDGISGIRPISSFDVPEDCFNKAGQIMNFQPENYLRKKGLRYLDRSTLLTLTAMKYALEDASIQSPDTNDLGLVLGTAFGSIHSIGEFTRKMICNGPKGVDPMQFPNTVINSPASQANIRYKMFDMCTTISSGFTASIDSIIYGALFIKMGRADIIAVGGVEELSQQSYFGFTKMNVMAKDSIYSVPFDSERNGVILGEGGVIFIMEDLDHALKRGTRILAEVAGFGTSFDPYAQNNFNPEAKGSTKSMRFALKDAQISPKEIDYICANANGSPQGDRMEAKAIGNVFESYSTSIPVTSVKSMLGECYGASGALQSAAAILAIQHGFIPPNINFKKGDPEFRLRIISAKGLEKKVKNVIVNSFGCNGVNSSIIYKKFIH